VEAIYGTGGNQVTSDKFVQNFVAAADWNNVLEKQEPEGTKKLEQTAQKQEPEGTKKLEQTAQKQGV
jgi:hypothetical protein